MIDITTIVVGDILKFKKPHPCGGFEWKVLRTGIDFKLECTKCQRVIMIPRIDAVKRIKEKKSES